MSRELAPLKQVLCILSNIFPGFGRGSLEIKLIPM